MLGAPAEAGELIAVHQFSGGAVGFTGVIDNGACVAGDLANGERQFANGAVAARAHVNMA